MKTHQIHLTTHPEAAPHLAALFTACAGGAEVIKGRTASGSREKLAAVIQGEAGELLRTRKPIRVRPETATTWLVIDPEGEDPDDPRADHVLAEVILAEMRRQGLSTYTAGERAGMSQKSVHNLTSAAVSPSWRAVRLILAALGKDLHWLADQLDSVRG